MNSLIEQEIMPVGDSLSKALSQVIKTCEIGGLSVPLRGENFQPVILGILLTE